MTLTLDKPVSCSTGMVTKAVSAITICCWFKIVEGGDMPGGKDILQMEDDR
jgi:hypothetical protein